MSEWFKEHDWKSCVRLKRTGGSNPLLCAIKKEHRLGVLFFVIFQVFEEDLWDELTVRQGVDNVLPVRDE